MRNIFFHLKFEKYYYVYFMFNTSFVLIEKALCKISESFLCCLFRKLNYGSVRSGTENYQDGDITDVLLVEYWSKVLNQPTTSCFTTSLFHIIQRYILQEQDKY